MKISKGIVLFLTFTILTSTIAVLGKTQASPNHACYSVESSANSQPLNGQTILVSEEHHFVGNSFESFYFDDFRALLAAQGYQAIVDNSTLTESLLSSVDVLLVFLPTEQYGASEIDAIENFVSAGGGLFCIGDISGWRVDDIIARWGFAQASGIVTDSNNYVKGEDSWVYYEAARGNFAVHPITNGLTKVQGAASSWLGALPSNAVSIITTDNDGTATPSGASIYAALDIGTGRIAISMDVDYFGWPRLRLEGADNALLALNTFAWLTGGRARANIEFIAHKYAQSGENYMISEVKVGNDPYTVIVYYPSSLTSPQIKDLTGAIVVDETSLEPLIASRDSTENFVVNSSITLALAKIRGWSTPDPSYWANLNQYAKVCYGSLLLMYGGVQALWVAVEFAVTGGLAVADIAVKMLEIGNFALSQGNALEKIGGQTDAILECNDAIIFVKDVYEGVDALQTVYEAYQVNNVISMNDMIEHANKIAYIKTTVFVIETSVDYVFTNDIGGMATSWLEVGEYTKALEGISTHISAVANSIVDGTVTPPQIHSLLASEVAYARFALLTWSAMANMYGNIVDKGSHNVWYWALDAPNSLKHYRLLYNNWLSVLAANEEKQKDFYYALDRLFQQSAERVLSEESQSSPNMDLVESISPLFSTLFLSVCVCMQRIIKKARGKWGNTIENL